MTFAIEITVDDRPARAALEAILERLDWLDAELRLADLEDHRWSDDGGREP